jgi:predicted DCC family thiol-disulfide oxidoreductase YuxK
MESNSFGERWKSLGRAIFGIDLRTLALFRVMLALGLITDLILRARDLTAHYSDHGILPRAALVTEFKAWFPSFHLMSGSAQVQGVLFVLAGLFALALLVGYRTRMVAMVSWVFLISLQARSQPISQGADLLLHVLLFWGMFLPLGARFSIDAALDRQVDSEANQYFSMATMALLIQCMSVYFFTALLKNSPVWLADGTAVYYALQIDYLATPFAIWLRQYPTVMHGLTYFVWFLELCAPLLMFAPFLRLPLRLLGMVLLIGMHLGFFLCLEIGIFPYVSITSLMVFTPGWVWDRLAAKGRNSKACALQIFYDEPCEFCRKVCLILRMFLLPPSVPIRAAQSDADIYQTMQQHNSWVVIDHDGSRHVRWDAVALVFLRSRWLAPVGCIFASKWMSAIGDRIYETIARNRGSLGRWSAATLPYKDREIHLSGAANIIVAALMLIVFVINLRTLPGVDFRVPTQIRSVATTLKLDQKWNMFAPAPSRMDGWFVVRGTTRDGTVVDVLNNRVGEPEWGRPKRLADEYSSYRWRKYLIRMKNDKEAAFRPHYARYLCYHWNLGRKTESRLEDLTVYFNGEWIMPDYGPRKAERKTLITYRCNRPLATIENPGVPGQSDTNEENF